MKKFLIFINFSILIFTSCSPKVAFFPSPTITQFPTITPNPTETLIPTPTLYPAFVELQKLLALSGERFTIMPDGNIQDKEMHISGLRIAPDGTMTLVVNGKEIVLDPADITFDDKDGVSVNGYRWDEANQNWVESEAILKAKADFAEYGYDITNYKVIERDGVAVAIDKETNKEVYVDGLYDLEFVFERAREQDLMPTNIEPNSKYLRTSDNYVKTQDQEGRSIAYFSSYLNRLRSEFEKKFGPFPERGKFGGTSLMLDPEILAWGRVFSTDRENLKSPMYLDYQLKDGTVIIVPLTLNFSHHDVGSFWIGRPKP